VSTWAFIKNGDPKETFSICETLLKDRHDLIHKACGWMLREVGKNCGLVTLNVFLEKHAHEMPRVMLRYALEKHSESQRKKYMNLL
jgi:3-methyladenine DNA glycosylase AlkD